MAVRLTRKSLGRNAISRLQEACLIITRKVPIRFLDAPLNEALQVAAHHMIYAYDAYCIVCARNQSSALITLDGGLQTAARAAHISLVELRA